MKDICVIIDSVSIGFYAERSAVRSHSTVHKCPIENYIEAIWEESIELQLKHVRCAMLLCVCLCVCALLVNMIFLFLPTWIVQKSWNRDQYDTIRIRGITFRKKKKTSICMQVEFDVFKSNRKKRNTYIENMDKELDFEWQAEEKGWLN